MPTEQIRTAMAASVSLGRIADSDEIVGTALYLASNASSYLNGALIVIDGG
jgi:NAD(P)-dependent dehydrogenase (short-subunit alcohol dehydrogenase family)